MNSFSQQAKTLYDFKAKTIDGKDFDFNKLKGKKVMIVNTASKCGYTPQYKQLEELYLKYNNKNFVIIGFPANNFLWQEPGTNSEIKDFCEKNYGVTFQMMEKISVKGKDMHPIYEWLTQKDQNKVKDAPVKWNFQKFLIDENGKFVEVYYSAENPLSDKITNWIEGK
jgi:glutathione peroxidase